MPFSRCFSLFFEVPIFLAFGGWVHYLAPPFLLFVSCFVLMVLTWDRNHSQIRRELQGPEDGMWCLFSAFPKGWFSKRGGLSPWFHAGVRWTCASGTQSVSGRVLQWTKREKSKKGEAMKRLIFIVFIAFTSSLHRLDRHKNALDATPPFGVPDTYYKHTGAVPIQVNRVQ